LQVFFLRKHILAFFFLLTYLISWGCWIAAARLPFGGFAVLVAIGAFGPAIAGFVCTGIANGREGLADLVRRIFAWRISWMAYLVALVVPFLLAFLPLVLYSFIGGPAVRTENLAFLPALIPLFLGMIIAGGLNEEPGWRGFALPVLRARHGSLVASLVIGILWGVWHIPLYAMGTPILIASLVGFIILVTLVSFLFTALANTTNDSVWIAIVFHAAYNTLIPNLPSLLGVPRTPQHQMIAVLLVVAMVFVVLWRWKTPHPRPLSHKEGER
jgi:membrane protease YdiL (CAAX protease family)